MSEEKSMIVVSYAISTAVKISGVIVVSYDALLNNQDKGQKENPVVM